MCGLMLRGRPAAALECEAGHTDLPPAGHTDLPPAESLQGAVCRWQCAGGSVQGQCRPLAARSWHKEKDVEGGPCWEGHVGWPCWVAMHVGWLGPRAHRLHLSSSSRSRSKPSSTCTHSPRGFYTVNIRSTSHGCERELEPLLSTADSSGSSASRTARLRLSQSRWDCRPRWWRISRRTLSELSSYVICSLSAGLRLASSGLAST